MHNFFRGWRRKLGVVTLVLACALVAGWIRSLNHGDLIAFAISDGECNTQSFQSVGGYLLWETYSVNPKQFVIVYSDEFEWFSIDNHLIPESTPELRRWTGIGIGEEGRAWVIAYRSVTIPLALLSTYFLLSKPRPAKKPEPSTTTGP